MLKKKRANKKAVQKLIDGKILYELKCYFIILLYICRQKYLKIEIENIFEN